MDKLEQMLQRQQYALAGRHSAVKICEWTKKSLCDKDVCYKQKFYGIRSHLCCQMSPSLNYCSNACVFCWRAIEFSKGHKMIGKIDSPKAIIENSIKAQQKLLSGFYGNPLANKKKLFDAQEPMHFAISLTGEPTIYPRLDELIGLLHKMKKTTFLVTNGQYPNALKKLKHLPAQLYVSISAPEEWLYLKIDRPYFKDAWKRLLSTLRFLGKSGKKTRTVLRLTLIKGLNMIKPEKYAELISIAKPMFIEAKAYMHVGYSRERLKIENMPRHQEVLEFARQIAKHSAYRIVDEKENSRVVLLMKKDSKKRHMKFK